MNIHLALRPSWPYLREVARSLLGVVLVAAVALEWGSDGAALAAGGSAAIAGATALQDSPRGRVPMVVGVSLGMGAAVLVGSLTSAFSVVFVVVVAMWCFAAGMLWALSANAGLVAAAATALLVTYPQASFSMSGAVTSAAFAVAGGLAQVALVAAWPRRRWRVQRDALTNAYLSVADHARRLAADPGASFDPDRLLWLRESFTLTESQARRRPPAYRGLYGLPERIAMTLTALRPDAAGADARDPVATLMAAAGDVLEAVAQRGRSARADAEAALARVDEAAATLPQVRTTAGLRLAMQLREAATLRFAGGSPSGNRVQQLRRPDLPGRLRSARDAVRGQLSRGSPVLRHAIRLAAGVAVGTAIARSAGMDHGSWIALTVLMVLRPETAHTYTRCVARVAGNMAGIVVATSIALALHPTGVASAVLAVVFLGVAYGVSGVSYVALSAALTAAIVFLIDNSGSVDGATIGERLLATLLGGAIAIATHLLLPDLSLVRLRQRAGEFLKAEVDYAATVIRAFVHPVDHPGDVMAAAWHRATRARSAFEAAVGSVRADSHEIRKRLKPYRATLNAVTASCAVLETNLPARPSVMLNRQFVVAVDDYVEALRGDSPAAGQPWAVDSAHLAEADQQLRQAASLLASEHAAQRVLVAEVASISRHLLQLAAHNDVRSARQ